MLHINLFYDVVNLQCSIAISFRALQACNAILQFVLRHCKFAIRYCTKFYAIVNMQCDVAICFRALHICNRALQLLLDCFQFSVWWGIKSHGKAPFRAVRQPVK